MYLVEEVNVGLGENLFQQIESAVGQMEERASFISCQLTVLLKVKTFTTDRLMVRLAGIRNGVY